MNTLAEHHEALPQELFDHTLREAIRQALRDLKAVDKKPRLEKLKSHMVMELDAQARAAALCMINGGIASGPDFGRQLFLLQTGAVHYASLSLVKEVLSEPEFQPKEGD